MKQGILDLPTNYRMDGVSAAIAEFRRADEHRSGKPAKLRTVYTLADKDHFTLEWYMTGPDGKEDRVVTLSHTRKKA